MKRQWQVVVGLILVILIVVFAAGNMASVKINVFFTSFSAPLILVILLCVLLGAVVVMLTSWGNFIRLKRQVKKLEMQQSTNEANLTLEVKKAVENTRLDYENKMASLKADYETQLTEEKNKNLKSDPLPDPLPKEGIDYFG